jgi:hypothetical protein
MCLVVVACAGAFLSGCSGESYPIEVTGNTGTCTESGTEWSGEPLSDALPGTILERTVKCAEVVMDDERLSGAYENAFRCEFTDESDKYIGHCTSTATLTNAKGAWHEEAGTFVITVIPGQHSRVVEDGVRVGTGDYEGLAFHYHVDSDTAYPWVVTGTLERVD